MSDVRTLPTPTPLLSLSLSLPPTMYHPAISADRCAGIKRFFVVVVAYVVIICHGAQKLPAFVASLKSGDEAEALRLLADEGSLVGLKDTVRNNTHHPRPRPRP